MTTVRARAKLNLFLRVVGRRADGYHDLVTLFDRISLYDEISVEPAATTTLQCDEPSLAGPGNLAHRAAQSLAKATKSSGFAVTLTKKIPIAAGLGGGSSDAAAVLVAGNELADRPVTAAELAELARALGADVPFFVAGERMAVGTGIGDVLTIVPEPPALHYVLLCPRLAVSTADVFGRWQMSRERPDLPDPERVVKSVSSGGVRDIASWVVNDLEPTVCAMHPEIRAATTALLEAGALVSALSGSGGTVFGLFDGDSQATNAYDVLVRDGRWVVFHACGE